MKKYSYYDIFFAVALIMAVADGNVYTFSLMAISSALELADAIKGIAGARKSHGKEA